MEKHAHMLAAVFECEAILPLKVWVNKSKWLKEFMICQISFYSIQLLDFKDKGGTHWGYIEEKCQN